MYVWVGWCVGGWINGNVGNWLVDTNMYEGINDRKGEFLKGRFVSWAQKVESKRNFVDIWKGWMDGWMDKWKDLISPTLFQGQFKILLGPVKDMKHVPYTRLVRK
jgi:hypothetical protein